MCLIITAIPLFVKEQESLAELSGIGSFSVTHEARISRNREENHLKMLLLWWSQIYWMDVLHLCGGCLSEGNRQTVNKSKPGSRQLSHEPCDQGQDKKLSAVVKTADKQNAFKALKRNLLYYPDIQGSDGHSGV